MAVSPTSIIALHTEFSAVSADTVDTFVLMASESLDSGQWGTVAKFYRASAYLAMHMMERAGLSSTAGAGGHAGGPVTSETAGKVSRAYGKPSVVAHEAGDEDLASTKFGLQFLRERNSCGNAGPCLLQPGINVTIAGETS